MKEYKPRRIFPNGKLGPPTSKFKEGFDRRRNLDGPPRSKLVFKNREIRDKIVDGLRSGLPYSKVAALAGVSPGILSRWLDKATSEANKFYSSLSLRGGTVHYDMEPNEWVELYVSLKEAEAEGESVNLRVVENAAAGNNQSVDVVEEYDGKEQLKRRKVVTRTIAPKWAAAAWILERRFPDRYGKRKVEETLAPGIDYELYRVARMLKAMPKSELENLKEKVNLSSKPRLVTADGKIIKDHRGR